MDGRTQHHAARIGHATDREGRFQYPHHERQDIAHAQALADRGIEVLELTDVFGAGQGRAADRCQLGFDARHDRSARHHLFKRPGQ